MYIYMIMIACIMLFCLCLFFCNRCCLYCELYNVLCECGKKGISLYRQVNGLCFSLCLFTVCVMYVICFVFVFLKLQSHYSDNQSPTSDNHFFLGGCRRLSEVGKCLSMIADQSAIGCKRITSTTSRRPPTTTFLGVFFGGIRWSANDCR